MAWGPRLLGLALLAAVAAAAWAIARAVPVLPAAPLALALGWASTFLVDRRGAVADGADWLGPRALRLGVMLLGAQLSLALIVERGAASIPLVLLTLAVVFGTVLVGGRLVGLPLELRLLMAAGIGICGNSAIAAAAPLVGASQRQVVTAVAMITVFGTAAVFAYPLIGGALGLSPGDQGLWSGVAIADTAQVVAAGFAVGPEVGEVATITKLTRNAFLGPIVILIALGARSISSTAPSLRLTAALPPFVIGFVALAALRSLGVLAADVGDAIAGVGGLAILVGLAGIGRALRSVRPERSDLRALAFGAATMMAISAMSLVILAVT